MIYFPLRANHCSQSRRPSGDQDPDPELHLGPGAERRGQVPHQFCANWLSVQNIFPADPPKLTFLLRLLVRKCPWCFTSTVTAARATLLHSKVSWETTASLLLQMAMRGAGEWMLDSVQTLSSLYDAGMFTTRRARRMMSSSSWT